MFGSDKTLKTGKNKGKMTNKEVYPLLTEKFTYRIDATQLGTKQTTSLKTTL